MSIRLVTGEPGAGKSLYVMRQLVDVITSTDRPIVTNLPLKLDPWVLGDKPQMGLRAYLEHEFGETFDIDSRVRFLSDEECFEFYRHRGRGIDVNAERDAKGNPIDLDWEAAKASGGVTYCIDEFWKFAGARDWATTGRALIAYGKQHRKLADDVWLCTHHPKDIDAAIQRIIETTVCMKNHGRMRIGLFRQPGMFTASHFQRVPQGNQAPMNTSHFRLDAAGLAQCYDTSAGVGLTGGAPADTKAKRGGVPFWVLIAIVILIALAATRIPWLISKGIGTATLAGAKSVHGVAVGTNSVPARMSAPSPSAANPPAVESPASSSGPGRVEGRPAGLVEFERPVPAMREDEAVTFNGIAHVPHTGEMLLFLSDGSTYRASEPEVRLVSRDFVVINDKVYRWKRAATALGEAVKPVRPAERFAMPIVPGNSRVVVAGGF
jgi:hypothetical protein